MTYHNENFHLLKFAVNRELNELYVSMTLRSLAFSTILLFVPIYLFKELSFTFNQIIYFYILYSLIFAFFTVPASKLMQKLGLKKTMLMSFFLHIAFFWILNMLKTEPGYFYHAAFILGMADAIFWIPFHWDFAMFSDKENRGSEISMWYTVSILAGLIGPLIGGTILKFFNFQVLFVIVSLLFIASAIPLFMSKDIKRKISFATRNVKFDIKDNVSYAGAGMVVIASAVFWPIFMFTILKGFLSLGSLVTIAGVVNILFILLIGKYTDSHERRRTTRIGSLLSASSWIIRIFVKTKAQLVFTTIYGGVAAVVMNIPFMALFYDKFKRNNIWYLIFRELSICGGRIIILISVLLAGDLTSAFWFAAIGSLLHMLV